MEIEIKKALDPDKLVKVSQNIPDEYYEYMERNNHVYPPIPTDSEASNLLPLASYNPNEYNLPTLTNSIDNIIINECKTVNPVAVRDSKEPLVTYIEEDSQKTDVECKSSIKFSSRLKNNVKNKRVTKIVAYMYTKNVTDYEIAYRVEGIYQNRGSSIIQSFDVFIDKSIIIDDKTCSYLKNEVGMDCFCMALKKASQYLVMLFDEKKIKKTAPLVSGFSIIDNKWFFSSMETLKEKNYPLITHKCFSLNLNNTVDETANNFYRIIMMHNDKLTVMMLCIIRIIGLLTRPLFEVGVRFDRIITINAETEKAMLYLQTFNRNNTFAVPQSINTSSEKLKNKILSSHSEILALEDEINVSLYRSKEGEKSVIKLYNMLYKDLPYEMNNHKLNIDNIIVVFTDRLNYQLSSDKVMTFDASGTKLDCNCDRLSVVSCMYEIDKLIVKDVISDKNTFENFLTVQLKKYNEEHNDRDSMLYAIIMTVYTVINKQLYGFCNMPVNEAEMSEYVIRILSDSSSVDNQNNIVKEFTYILNQEILSKKIEIIVNSKISNSFGASGENDVIYTADGFLYIENELFEKLTEKMKLCSNSCALRKSLKTQGLIKYNSPDSDDALKYKVTLYGNCKAGLSVVTAVNINILSEEAKRHLKGGVVNITPCNDDLSIERISLGNCIMTKNPVYWSIGHNEAQSGHAICIGKTGTGKTVGVNLIAKQLFENGHYVVYVHYKNGNAANELATHGFGYNYIKENMYEVKMDDVLNGNQTLEDVFDKDKYDRKLLVFSNDNYNNSIKNNNVEKFLKHLYEFICNNININIILVIDEAHKLQHKKGCALYDIIQMGRGNGIHLIAVYQGIHQLSKSQFSMVSQADIIIGFKMSNDEDACRIAESRFLKPYREFASELCGLKKRQCMIIGLLEDTEGVLQENRFIKVEVPEITLK